MHRETHFMLCTFMIVLHSSLSHVTQELPEKWKSLRKIAFTVKHEVAPLQSNEVSVIRRKCVRFEVRPCVSWVGCQCRSPLQRAQYLTYKPSHFLSCIIYDQSHSAASVYRYRLRDGGRYAWELQPQRILNVQFFFIHIVGQ